MISVQEALDKIFALLEPLDAESIELRKASGRVLAEAVIASRAQPPFSASVMDGYAVATADVYAGDTFSVIGEAAAGSRFEGRVETGQAVRIFTGAPAPDGAQRVLIQEDVSRDADTIQVKENADSSLYIRDAGADFAEGAEIPAGRKLTTADIALAAAMNTPTVRAFRQPIVALIPTGDELVMPGEDPTDDQIIASNIFGLAAMLESEGAIVRILPIARDNEAALSAVFDLAKGADLVVTIGGASVGDHDLVGTVAADRGMERSFYKIAMRPGKPLMAGRMDGTPMIGLPGNPVSAMVCGHVFLRPAVRALQGLAKEALPTRSMPLAAPLSANGPRAHYMRAAIAHGSVTAASRQDSALLTVLASADALIVRPPQDGPRDTGETVQIIDI